MSGKSSNSYSYREANVANLSLPAEIICERCHKKKALRNFAKKRQYDAKDKLRKGKQPTAICMLCTGSPIKELQCSLCDAWKHIDDFSKAQRKDPDDARCEKCMRDQTETEPIEAGDTHGYSDDSDDEDGAGCSMPTPTFEEDTEGLSVDLLGLCVGDNKQGNSAKQSNHAGPAVKSRDGQPAVGGAPLTFGFDPKAYSSRASSTINSMAANPPTSRNGNFAKVPGYKPKKSKKEQEEEEEEEKKKEEEEGSDSDNDWQGEQEDDEELDEDEI